MKKTNKLQFNLNSCLYPVQSNQNNPTSLCSYMLIWFYTCLKYYYTTCVYYYSGIKVCILCFCVTSVCVVIILFYLFYYQLSIVDSLFFSLLLRKQVNFPGKVSIKSYLMIVVDKWLYHWSAFYQLKSITKVKDLVTRQDLEYFYLKQNYFIHQNEKANSDLKLPSGQDSPHHPSPSISN